MKTKFLVMFAIIGLWLALPVSALEYPLSQLRRMRFARTASLYLTEAGIEEDSQGIEPSKPEPSRLPGTHSFSKAEATAAIMRKTSATGDWKYEEIKLDTLSLEG